MAHRRVLFPHFLLSPMPCTRNCFDRVPVVCKSQDESTGCRLWYMFSTPDERSVLLVSLLDRALIYRRGLRLCSSRINKSPTIPVNNITHLYKFNDVFNIVIVMIKGNVIITMMIIDFTVVVTTRALTFSL